MSLPEITISNVSTAIGLVSTSFNIYRNKEYIYNGLLTAGYYVDSKLDTEFFKGQTFYNVKQIELNNIRESASEAQAPLNNKQPKIIRSKRKSRRKK